MEVRNLTEFGVSSERVKELCSRLLELVRGVPPELSVVFVDDETITELHERYYGEAGVTDVLAFPYDEESAEIVLNPYQHRRQAPTVGNSLPEEVAENLVHALLHLAGYDHTDPSDEGEHLREQQRLMGVLPERGIRSLIQSEPPRESTDRSLRNERD